MFLLALLACDPYEAGFDDGCAAGAAAAEQAGDLHGSECRRPSPAFVCYAAGDGPEAEGWQDGCEACFDDAYAEAWAAAWDVGVCGERP